jgi:predicted exporter
MMTSAYGSMESANNTLLVNFVDSISQQTMQVFPDIDIAITGSPVIAVDNANQIKADSRLAIFIAVILILCLLIFSFRSTKNLLLIGVSILFGWLFAMAFIAVLRDNVSLIVLGIGSVIIGIAVNYPLHFVAHIGHGGSVRDVLKDMISPLLIGNITTVGAFASLIPLDAPALHDLGLFAAFMLVGTILFVLVFLPHLVKKTEEKKEYLLFGKVSSMTHKIRGWMFGVIVLLTIVLGLFSLNTSFDANMHHINYLTPIQERLMADLNISAGVTTHRTSM